MSDLWQHMPERLASRYRAHDTREAWLADRQARIAAGGIGSTTAAALLGLSPWRTRWECWAAVHAPERLEPFSGDTRLLERGLALEPMVDRIYREQTSDVAETFGVDLHITATHPSGVITTTPDALVLLDDGRVGIGEYKVIQPWKTDGYPAEPIEAATIEDIDALSTGGRWPVERQYVVQCLTHLIATGLDFVDLFAVAVEDVMVGHDEPGWDTPVAVRSVHRMRINRDAATLTQVGGAIMTARARYVMTEDEPGHDDGQPPAPWGDRSDPLSGKRDATVEEAGILEAIAAATADETAAKATKSALRSELRDLIEASGNVGIKAQSTGSKAITASISNRGTLTIRGL